MEVSIFEVGLIGAYLGNTLQGMIFVVRSFKAPKAKKVRVKWKQAPCPLSTRKKCSFWTFHTVMRESEQRRKHIGDISVHETNRLKSRGGDRKLLSPVPLCVKLGRTCPQRWCLNHYECRTIVTVQVVTYTLAIDFKLTCVLRTPFWFGFESH